LDEKNGGPLTALHVSKRGIFRLGFQNLGETLLGVLSEHPQKMPVMLLAIFRRVKTVLSYRQSRVFSRTRFKSAVGSWLSETQRGLSRPSSGNVAAPERWRAPPLCPLLAASGHASRMDAVSPPSTPWRHVVETPPSTPLPPPPPPMVSPSGAVCDW